MTPLLQLGLIVLGLYLAGWISGKLGLSSIVGYILLGVLFGPSGPFPFYEITPITDLLGELGIVLLLFFMGLEFSLRRFLEGGRQMAVAGSIDLLNFPVGVAAGLAFGFGPVASLFLGGVVYISSSGVIVKLLTDEDLAAYPEAERSLLVLVFEDLAMVVILGGLALLTAGGGIGQLLGVLAFLAIYVGLLRFGRGFLERLLGREGEALVLLVLAMITLFAVGATELNFPEAVAAFLLGMIIAETHHRERVEHALASWRDVAAAAFFLDFGLHVELRSALGQWPLAMLLVTATVAMQLITGSLSGYATGLSRRGGFGHGLMLLPRGEFSLVIAGLAASTPAIRAPVQEALVGATSLYVLTMVVLGSLAFRHYERINAWLGARLRSPAARRAEAERQRDLDSVTLD